VSAFVPMGYITIYDALNRVGRELFPAEWTGEEHRARTGLLSEDEWSKTKDLAPPTGGGAEGGGRYQASNVPSKKAATPHSTGDPSDPSYQTEYQAHERYAAARHQLRVRLEAGRFEAAILDPFSGTIHQARVSLWRQHNADRMIAKGEAPIPNSPNTGSLLIKAFPDASGHTKPMPEAKIREAIDILKEKTATEKLTRPQQKEFVRKSFPNFHVTERQMNQIFQAVPVLIGRRKKSNKKV
jgi:hypothetical protein